MTEFPQLLVADRGEDAVTLTLVDKPGFDAWLSGLSDSARTAVSATGFAGKPDTLAWTGEGFAVGVKDASAPGRWDLAHAAAALPAGRYRLAAEAPLRMAGHGWLMAQHSFTRYRKPEEPKGPRVLLTADAAAIDLALREAEAAALVRDLVDTPANDMGPGEVEAAVRAVAGTHGASVQVVQGEALLDQNFPAIHAVGRASPRAPRLIRLDWGDPNHSPVALVGKGVCFDTGGLNLKPGNSMALMKKDMGGAAHALALASMIMAARLPVRLSLYIAAVDNAVSGDAMRPGDVLQTRKGLSVEVGNTDAEGRLVLADALALACEGEPRLVIDFATLTGAARVALGPELPALFTNDDALASELLAAGEQNGDPLWRLPLWQPYRSMFKSSVADINNNAEGGFAGAIVGALFLERFVTDKLPWAHFDLFAWNPTPKPGRPKGGAAMTLWACFDVLKARFGQ